MTNAWEGQTVDGPAVQAHDEAAPVDALRVLSPGARLGSYVVREAMGSGAMGDVYRAEHTLIGREVALKVLRPAFAQNARGLERFFAEAQAVNRVKHPGVVEITDLFVEDDVPCIVMELLRGETLGQALSRGPLPSGTLREVGAQIAVALDAVHKAGVVHRDLKPDNIFLCGDDDTAPLRVKLLDFGVAKLGQAPLGRGRTAVGSIIGTPEYMAPEQLAGKAVDARADTYALGVVLYQAATGVLPFRGDSFGELVVKHLTLAPPLPSRHADVPRDLERVILALLQKDPGDRPGSLVDVAGALRGDVHLAPPRRRPRAVWMAAAAAVVLVAGGAVAAFGGFDASSPEPALVVESAPTPTPPAPSTPPPEPTLTSTNADTAPAVDPPPPPASPRTARPRLSSARGEAKPKRATPAPATTSTSPAAAAAPTRRGVVDPFAVGAP
jgi:serine/threonine protein kinase